MVNPRGPPQKEAVVYILDAFPSMNTEYLDPSIKKEEGASIPTRLDAAKKVIEGMVYASMLSAGNKVLIIVCKTPGTRHHLLPRDEEFEELDPEDICFPNITELGPQMDLAPPSVMLLQELGHVQAAKSIDDYTTDDNNNNNNNDNVRGDILDALVVAADALYKATGKYRFRRKIVIVTDACHDFALNITQMRAIIDSLREMECSLHVLGLNFQTKSVEIEQPMPALAAIKQEENEGPDNKRVKRENNTNDDEEMDSDTSTEEDTEDENEDEDEPQPDAFESNQDGEEIVYYNCQEDREHLLINLTEKTGGSVLSVENMNQLLDAKVGKRVVKGTPKNMQLHVGPGLTVPVKRVKLMEKASISKGTKEEAVKLDEEGKPKVNSLGHEITEKVASKYKNAQYMIYDDGTGEKSSNFNDDETDAAGGGGGSGDFDLGNWKPVDPDDIADSVRYGKDLVPMGEMDFEGLKISDEKNYEDDTFDVTAPYIDILGYVDRNSIPLQFFLGPPYGVTGHDSVNTCTLIAALAQVLKEKDRAAICAVKATKTGSADLNVMLPFEEPLWKGREPTRLLMMSVPFGDEARSFGLPSFEDILGGKEDSGSESDDEEEKKKRRTKAEASDKLVKSLMLPDDAVCSENIRHPYLRLFHRTILNRAMNRNPTSEEDLPRGRDVAGIDPMLTPYDVLERAKPALDEFRQAFPLKKKKIKKISTAKVRGPLTHTEFLEDDDDDDE